MWKKPLPAAMRGVDYCKVGDLHEQHCPRCGVHHGDFFAGGLDIKNGRAFCRACGRFRGSVKKAAPRRRRTSARPVIVHATPVSTPRPREHRTMPRGRDGTERRDDGSGSSDEGSGGDGPPQLRAGQAPSLNGRWP